MNKYTGEHQIIINGKVCTLVLDWRALAEIQTKHGADILKELSRGISFEVIADVLAIGFKKKNPEVTKETILDASPPFVDMVKAIDQALAYAYFGPDGAPEIDADAPASDDAKKKTE